MTCSDKVAKRDVRHSASKPDPKQTSKAQCPKCEHDAHPNELCEAPGINRTFCNCEPPAAT